jgi:hypothetical protein
MRNIYQKTVELVRWLAHPRSTGSIPMCDHFPL